MKIYEFSYDYKKMMRVGRAMSQKPVATQEQEESAFILMATIGLALAMILMFGCQKPAFAQEIKQSDANHIVAEVIAAEACNQGFEGMHAIANVIANRVRAGVGNSAYEVVTQPKQFFGYTNPNRTRIYLGCKSDADYLADNLMDLKDMTYGATHFENPDFNSPAKWIKTYMKIVKIRDHVFYKEVR